MKLIHPDVKILDQAPGLTGVYDAICQAAATCYKSEAKTGEQAKAFIDDVLIKRGHLAMLEFGTVYLTIPKDDYEQTFNKERCPYVTKQATVVEEDENNFYITTNLRVLYENNWMDDLECFQEPSEHHEKRYFVQFITSIGIGREFTRHRVFSFAQESTRYCNYSKDKFSKQVTFILPSWSKIEEGEYNLLQELGLLYPKDMAFARSCGVAEKHYFNLIESGAVPQEAREVLPLCTKADLCMCGFKKDWVHFMDLRFRGITGKPHPDAQLIATKLHKLFEERGIDL